MKVTEEELKAAEAVVGVATKTSYTAGAGTIIFGFNMNEIGVLSGIIIGVLTLLVNIYFQAKKHKLEVIKTCANLGLDELPDVESVKILKDDFLKADRRKNGVGEWDGVERRKR